MFLTNLGEHSIIRGLARRFNVRHPRIIKGIGDDTSVTRQKGGKVLLATTDVLIEDVHFSFLYTPPYLLGKKSVSISLSDIAAMGGTPLFLLVSLGLPPRTTREFLDEFYAGISRRCREFGVSLIGGNISRLPGRVLVSTTLLGEAKRGKVVFRSGARVGDAVYVTGTVGDSALGLRVLKKEGKGALKKGPFKKAVLKHLDPAPRVKEGKILAERNIASSMIDISDGLVSDLRRLSEESKVSFVVELARLPLSDDLKRHLSKNPDPIKNLALSGGEDYELLFTGPPVTGRRLESLEKELGCPVTPIGHTVPGKRGVSVVDLEGVPVKLLKEGFEHF